MKAEHCAGAWEIMRRRKWGAFGCGQYASDAGRRAQREFAEWI